MRRWQKTGLPVKSYSGLGLTLIVLFLQSQSSQ